MKLLFDEHFSFRSVRRLLDIFPEAKHLKFFGLETKEDTVIWNFAMKEGFCIVTKDDDFYQKSLLKGSPPKVIWVKGGNISNPNLEVFLREKSNVILDFQNQNEALLILQYT